MSKITIKEAFDQGIAKLRRDPWEPSAHIELEITSLPSGKRVHGPWVTLHGIGVREDGTVGPTETPLLWADLDWTERAWEPWERSPTS